MWPWGHLLVGYLVYTAGIRLWHRRAPDGAPVVLVAVGTQVPDLIDKPANWYFDIFDGRAMGHSLLTMVPVCVAGYLLARHYERGALGVGLSVGVVTHLVTDAKAGLLAGNITEGAPYLLWPVLPAPTYPSESLFDHIRRLAGSLGAIDLSSVSAILTSELALHVGIFLGLLLIWALDGFPGVRTLYGIVPRCRRFLGQWL